jgi:hypothetical protein
MGSVVFTLGSIAWSVIGLSSGQTNLLATNGFLTLVSLIGVWRWLGKQRAYEDGDKSATEESRRSASPTLFTASGIAGMPVTARDGTSIGKAVEALIACEDAALSYVVIASSGVGGIGEELRAVARADLTFAGDSLKLRRESGLVPGLAAAGRWRLATRAGIETAARAPCQNYRGTMAGPAPGEGSCVIHTGLE